MVFAITRPPPVAGPVMFAGAAAVSVLQAGVATPETVVARTMAATAPEAAGTRATSRRGVRLKPTRVRRLRIGVSIRTYERVVAPKARPVASRARTGVEVGPMIWPTNVMTGKCHR